MHLIILKSNIDNKDKYDTVKACLSNNKFITQWSVDMEDTDKVLRISCTIELREDEVIQLMQTIGIHCKELI